MSRYDARARLLFARKVKRILSRDFWTNGIGFYFDRALWTHKTNLCDHSRPTTTMACRKKSESLTLKCTTKGKQKRALGVKLRKCL